MNAIYARQSVDRADSISIESQIEFCRYELKGEPYKVYADRGYSGKNTDRPAFGEMMRDMENGTIRRVVVYKLDRISRSILDFSRMMERFEANRVEFVSTTEKFDTSSPMGRAMLNICIVFAQGDDPEARGGRLLLPQPEKSLYGRPGAIRLPSEPHDRRRRQNLYVRCQRRGGKAGTADL